MATNRPRYDDKFRASAVVMLEAAGYPDNPFKLAEVARELKVPSRTLRRWYNGENNPPPDNVVTDTKKELAERLEELAHRLLDKAFAVLDLDDPNIQQITTSLAIVIDKKQLLDGKATERKELTGKDGGAIETKTTLLSELSDDDLDRILRGEPPPGERGKGAPSPAT